MKRSAQPFALRRPHDGRRAFGAQEGDLLLKGTRHVLAPVVVADRQATGDAPGEAAEVLSHALAERLQRLKAGTMVGGMHAHAFGVVVIDGDEYRDLPSAGQ